MANSDGIKIEIDERLLIDSQKLSAVVKWLEANQPDVFRRGLWDAIAHPVQPAPQAVNAELLEALKRLVATDDAHATIHAPDGDDVARMIEYAEAFDHARAAIAKATA